MSGAITLNRSREGKAGKSTRNGRGGIFDDGGCILGFIDTYVINLNRLSEAIVTKSGAVAFPPPKSSKGNTLPFDSEPMRRRTGDMECTDMGEENPEDWPN